MDDHKRIHWKAWWKLCIPKGKGGMGFRDLHSFNLAMLAKQVWRLLAEPDSLCARVLRAKYYPDGRLLQAKYSRRFGVFQTRVYMEGWRWITN